MPASIPVSGIQPNMM